AYPGTWQTMLWRGDDAARYAFFVTPDNKLLFTSGANNAIRSSVELAVGSWQHVMAVQEAGHPSRRRRLYINGVEVASSPAAQPADGLGDLFIGSRRADSYEAFAGDLDEVRIYNRALLDEEILSFSGQNAPPIANAGPNLTLVDWDDSGSEPVTLDGSASTDPDGTIVNYRWVEGVTVLAEGATPTAAVDLAVGTHTIALDVTDNDARTVTDTIIVTISPQPPNSAPVVDAGPDLTIKLGDRFYIDSASVTDDPLPITPGIVSVLWTEQGSSVATWPLADQTSVDTHVEFSAVGTYTLRLTADDGELTAFDELSVTVLEFGLDTRASNPNCVAPPRPTAGASAATEDPFPASPGFNRITKILQAPGDASRWFVLEQAGRVQVFDVADPATVQTYLDFSASVRDVGNEEGLLGMAFHPNFPTVPELFVNYIAGTSDATRHSRVSRFILDDPVAPVVVTEQILLTVDQPRDNHNGGELSFGPDGYLYLGLGDGGGDGDTFDNAQNTTNLLGSMLRIDVLGVPFPAPGYQVPPDNPFAGNPRCGPTASHADSCPELYAWGLRNSWRWSFDAPTGQLWLADVGEVGWEEVDLIKRGGNYGWDCREGAHDFELDGCPAGGLIDPVFEYQRGQGWAITGGYVYRNTTIPGLAGRYVFGDYGSGRIWALQPDGQGGYLKEELIDTPWPISTFGLGVDGELYFADFANGRLRRLVAAGPGNPDTIPDNLADTGCVDPVDPTQPAPGLIPYTINAPFWSDDAVKTRWLALPDGTSIDIDASDDFVFPNGAVIVKNFALNDQLVETRLLMRHPDGFWGGYTYEWNDTVTAATRVRGGKTRAVGGQQWIYPSEGECLNCHTSAAGFSLGPELAQLNGDLNYPSTGITANQLETLDHILLFTDPLPGPASTLPAIPDPADITAPLAERARAYLDINCSGCHRPTGPTPSGMDLRYPTAFPATNTCDVLPVGDDLDIGPTARLIAPGNSAASLIPARMNRRDAHGMPPLGSAIADGVGVSLIDAWIDSLTNCN
ncbi:MAG: PQQ-dependent sugar dehydrogenase, partial [Chromatiales bacterium]